MTYGILHPVILVPEDMDWHDENTVKFVLEHEFIHICRFDMAKKLALAAVLCVHWFNPAVWLMYVLAGNDIELCCDEAVILRFGRSERASYAMALIHMEEQRKSFAAIYSSFGQGIIKRRITAIMKTKKGTVFTMIFAAALVIAVAVTFAVTYQEAEDDYTEVNTDGYIYADATSFQKSLVKENLSFRFSAEYGGILYAVTGSGEGNNIYEVYPNTGNLIYKAGEGQTIIAIWADSDGFKIVDKEITEKENGLHEYVQTVRALDFSGQETFSVEIARNGVTYEGLNYNVIASDSNGNIYVAKSSELLRITPDGTVEKMESKPRIPSGFFYGGDGELYMYAFSGAITSICRVEPENETQSEGLIYIEGEYCFGNGVGEYLAVLGDDDNIYYLTYTGELVTAVNFEGCNITVRSMNALMSNGDNRFVVDDKYGIFEIDETALAGKKTISVGVIFGSDAGVENLIETFNAYSDEYEVIIKEYEYGENCEELFQNVLNDMKQGNGPDMVICVERPDGMVESGVLLNLYDFMEGDSELQADDILLREAMEYDGGLYAIGAHYKLNIYYGLMSDVYGYNISAPLIYWGEISSPSIIRTIETWIYGTEMSFENVRCEAEFEEYFGINAYSENAQDAWMLLKYILLSDYMYSRVTIKQSMDKYVSELLNPVDEYGDPMEPFCTREQIDKFYKLIDLCTDQEYNRGKYEFFYDMTEEEETDYLLSSKYFQEEACPVYLMIYGRYILTKAGENGKKLASMDGGKSYFEIKFSGNSHDLSVYADAEWWSMEYWLLNSDNNKITYDENGNIVPPVESPVSNIFSSSLDGSDGVIWNNMQFSSDPHVVWYIGFDKYVLTLLGENGEKLMSADGGETWYEVSYVPQSDGLALYIDGEWVRVVDAIMLNENCNIIYDEDGRSITPEIVLNKQTD